MKNLRRELKETEKSKLDELLPRKNEVLGNEMDPKVIELQKKVMEIDAKIKKIRIY